MREVEQLGMTQSDQLEAKEHFILEEYMYGANREHRCPHVKTPESCKQINPCRKLRQIKVNKIKWQGILSNRFSLYLVYQTHYLGIWRTLFQDMLKQRRRQDEARKNTNR